MTDDAGTMIDSQYDVEYDAGHDERPERRREVPRWVWIAAVVSAVIVVGLAGYFVRGVIEDRGVRRTSDARIERWSTEVNQNPTSTLARIELGYAYQAAGRLEEAISQYDAVLDEDPNNVAALYNRGAILLDLNLEDEAEKALWRALEVEPDHIQAATALGRMYEARGEYRSVLAAVRPVVGAHADSAELQYLTGLAYENTGHPDWAAARYRLALQASPDHKESRDALRRLGETP